MDADAYLSKSPAAGRMGAAAEHLIAASCIIATRGELNVSTTLVDDEGVDLVFHKRGSTATLAVQVKARFSDGVGVQQGKFLAHVRANTFSPRDDFDLLFAAVDVERGAVECAWLIPSPQFNDRKGSLRTQGTYRFVASMKADSQDQWRPWRKTPSELPTAILERLSALGLPREVPVATAGNTR
jgi:hypothetical protein